VAQTLTGKPTKSGCLSGFWCKADEISQTAESLQVARSRLAMPLDGGRPLRHKPTTVSPFGHQ
jgi:hypothetical protein